MDRETADAYEAGAGAYVERRRAYLPERAEAFAARVPDGGMRIDLGCGPGHYLPLLGEPLVALDAAAAMLDLVPERSATALRVNADLEALPFRRGALAGAWASKCYQHVSRGDLPMALADLHRSLAVGAPLQLDVFGGEGERVTGPDDDLPGRRFHGWSPDRLADVVRGAGFDVGAVEVDGIHLRAAATRARTLPDYVAPGLRLLVSGLNPSFYATDAGVGYARPGNRFWPAALAAGIVDASLDPVRAVRVCGVGMTDLVKRPSVGADELTAEEYRDGVARLDRLCGWLRPGAVCLLGLGGWRAAVDRKAVAGPQDRRLGGVPVYVMPNPSGRQAHVGLDGLVAHLRAAAELADEQT